MNAGTKKLIESKEYQLIEESLFETLQQNNTIGEHYADLVRDYMDLWITKCLLVEDIQKRGVSIVYDNGGGQKGRKKNDSVEQRIKVNAQMLKLLSEIGIKPSQTNDGDNNAEM